MSNEKEDQRKQPTTGEITLSMQARRRPGEVPHTEIDITVKAEPDGSVKAKIGEIRAHQLSSVGKVLAMFGGLLHGSNAELVYTAPDQPQPSAGGPNPD